MCLSVCVRITSILSWQHAQPPSLLPHFSLSSSLPPGFSPVIFPGGNLISLSPLSLCVCLCLCCCSSCPFSPHLAHHQCLPLFKVARSDKHIAPSPSFVLQTAIPTSGGQITEGVEAKLDPAPAVSMPLALAGFV